MAWQDETSNKSVNHSLHEQHYFPNLFLTELGNAKLIWEESRFQDTVTDMLPQHARERHEAFKQSR